MIYLHATVFGLLYWVSEFLTVCAFFYLWREFWLRIGKAAQ